jgi:hypothetical protein
LPVTIKESTIVSIVPKVLQLMPFVKLLLCESLTN